MSYFTVHPTWHNYSSLVREASATDDAGTRMERSHHMAASLYFGIAALEAFLNGEMRGHLSSSATEVQILKLIRRTPILTKIRDWPNEILPRPLMLNDGVFKLIELCNSVRGELIHLKTAGSRIYKDLETIDPPTITNSVAEYIVGFSEAQDHLFPYWLFGWNYLSPRNDGYEIVLVNEQQFCCSLHALGFDVPTFPAYADCWRKTYLGTQDGFIKIRDALRSVEHCEPKAKAFPYAPILCRRWWTSDHQRRCGAVSQSALQQAIDRKL